MIFAARTPACLTSVNYGDVPGDRILPFLFELDENNSVLTPPEGENQRFCYTITANGEDANEYADLSHFVLGICGEITREMLESVTVVRDGVPQEVVFGENVELRRLSADPTTGCLGLKFNFALNKVTGVMQICFELNQTFPVGPTRVCVKGGQQVQTGLFICGPACENGAACETVAYQRMNVCVPVTVTPWARAGEPVTRCCGEPVITPGAQVCPEARSEPCRFTITRTLCVAIPVAFGADAVPGVPSTNCLGVSADDTCTDCGAGEE